MSLRVARNLIAAYNDALTRYTSVAVDRLLSKVYYDQVVSEVEVYRHMQMWGTLAGGFYDIKEPPAVFSEETIIVVFDDTCCVYFGGNFAYCAEINVEIKAMIYDQVVPDNYNIRQITKVHEANHSREAC